MEKNIFLMAGEASGDQHGAMLVSSLKKLDENLHFYGVGASELRRQGVSLLYNSAQFEAFGVIEPIFKISFYRRALKKILSLVKEKNISSVILIDFPGFNLILAGRLKKIGVRVIYYISPQIWAWHYSRIKKIKKYVDAMVALYPFEEEMYKKEGLRAFFAGNPIVDRVMDKLDQDADINIKISHPCIALMPGSRLSEIKRHLPSLLDAAIRLKKKFNGSFIIPVLSGDAENFVREELLRYDPGDLNPYVVVDNTCKSMEMADLIIMSSGTATLEAAIIGKPMIIIYRVSFINELIARLVVRVDNISLVNIVAGKKVCAELLQGAMNSDKIYEEACRLLDHNDLYNEMSKELNAIKDKLGRPGAIDRIAKVVLSLIYE